MAKLKWILTVPLALTICASAPEIRAASGTWINAEGGTWTNAANWSGGIVADGSGNTANFGTLSLSSAPVLTLDAPRTIGNIVFDDQSATKHGWSLNSGNGSTLTLAGAAPTITVNNATSIISAPIAGAAGLTKAGTAKLILTGPLSYTGNTTINAGTLTLPNASFSTGSTLNISAGTVVESPATISLLVNATATVVDLTGTGVLKLTSTTNSPSSPDLYFGPNHVSNNDWAARLAAPVDLGNVQRFIFGKTGHNGVGPYGLTGADCQFGGPISGSGGLTFIAQNDWTGTGPMEVPFALNAANTFTGPVEIQRGSVYLGNANALTRTNSVSFNPISSFNARLFLYGNNAVIGNLSSPGAGSALIANGNLKNGATVTLGAVTLTINQSNNDTFDGIIADVYPEYTGSGSGTTGPLNLAKTGSGTLRLTGAHTYSGTTTVNAGNLELDGSLGPGNLLVNTGAALTGTGTASAPVQVQAGGLLSPGTAGLGTFTFNNSVTLAGNVIMEISKNGATLANDHISGVVSLLYGGSLTISNLGPGLLATANTFSLFSATTYSGAFSSLLLPGLSGGLSWDTGNLTNDGSLTVVAASAPPIIITQPQNVTANPGGSATFNVLAAGVRPINYQWYNPSGKLQGETNLTYLDAAVSTNDAGSYFAVATNPFGSTTSQVAVLTVNTGQPSSTITNGLVVYLNFDNNLSAQGGTTNSGSLYLGGATAGPRYTPGMIGSAASFANSATSGQPEDWAVTLGNLEWIYSGSFSFSLWERSSTSSDGALLGNKDWTSGADVGWVVSTLDPKNINWNASGGTRRDIDLNPPFSDGNWHLVTVTFSRALNQVISYIDGTAVNTSDISPSASASFNAGFATLVGSSGNGQYSGAADLDDLGIWTRVLTSQEIAGIYGAGLRHQPLIQAIPGDPPVITTQPVDISVSSGSTATFTIAITGPGPFQYQWRLNGTNIIGATNATLFLPSVNAASQGVYSVLISNESGAVVSAGAHLTVYNLTVTGQWDFDQADLRATVGADLEFYGDAGSIASFPPMTIGGQLAGVLAFGSNSVSQGIYMRHGAKPNGGGHFVNQYTLLMDVMFPTQSTGRWRALFQSDPFNHPGNVAEFLVGDSSSQPNPGGIGAESQFDGTLAANTWYRIAFVVDLAAPAGQQLTKYVNGLNVGNQSLPGGIDGRYALGPTALLFTSGLAGFTSPGFVNSIQFVNGTMTSDVLAALGGPSAVGLPPGNGVLKITSISRNASLITMGWSGPDGQFQLQNTSNLANPAWQNVTGLTSNRSLSLPITNATSFYRVKESFPDIQVGQLPNAEQSLPTKQILRAAGHQLQFSGRPVDLALSPDGKTAFIKNINSLLVIDTATWTLIQTLNYPGSGASMHGIAVNPAGSHVYVTSAGNELYDWAIATNGAISFSRTISMPGSDPCGLALSSNGNTAYVCLSIANSLAVVDLPSGTVTRQISVGIAPFDVALSPDGNSAWVSDWGGRFPTGGDATATSAGTPVLVDARGVASSGAVSLVNLVSGTETVKVPTGLHPSDLQLNPDGSRLYVANANSDTVSVIDTASRAVIETILVRPDPAFPYGSASDALALSRDGTNLFVATAGNNAIAVIELPNALHTNSVLQGFLPADSYPGAVVADSNSLYIANVKGLGSRDGQPANTTWQITAFLGTANKIPIPQVEALSKYTAQVFEDGRIPQIRQTQLVSRSGQPPLPVPARVGEPSVFQHVLYILKENKTYDQVFGDMSQANGNPSLCIYPQSISPNHHALASQYVLLDNYYCNGINSADGHSWSTEANNTDHLEKSFGGFSRSYTFGDDPLTYSSTGFIWNNALQHGLTFRNYGEFDYASPVPANATWLQIYADFTNGTHSIKYSQNIGVASLRPYSSTNVPGWNLGIPDVVRADGFIRELNQAQVSGNWAAFHLLYLPNDHTGGPPTPQAQVADNDLSLGQVVEAVTKSVFGSNTVIFVIEDDPQSGYDHVDAHRSICLVISPYTKRGQVISTFYNQAGVLHTMERILGLPPMNQQDAMAPLMFDCFTNVPDFTPYTALANNIPLAQGTSGGASLSRKQQYWAAQHLKMDFSKPDLINEDQFNRYIWFMVKGDIPYPARFVGGHGRGLKRLGLTLDKSQKDDD